ncbi:MAG: TAXI family TRAP transporter solute-binding subunit [Vicinamibacterales bacterium]
MQRQPGAGTCLLVVSLALIAASCGRAGHASADAQSRVIRYLTPASPGAFSAGLIDRMRSAMPGVGVESVHTSGSLIVLSSLQQGKGDFGFSLADVAYMAYRKGLDGEPYPHGNLRAVAVRWMSTMYAFVRRDGSIRSVADFKGRRVGVVQPGAAGELLARLLLEAHGLTYDDVQPVFTAPEQLAAHVASGQLDAAIFPATPLIDVGRVIGRFELRTVELDRDVVRRLQGEYPFVKSVSLDTGLVGSSGRLTVGVDSVLVCRADLDEQLVYELTRVFYSILSDMSRTQSGVDPNTAAAAPIPLHPGAARFYRERQVLNES